MHRVSRGPTVDARAHLIALNQALRDVCVAKAPRCVFDGNAVYNWNFTLGDFSSQDYFHFSSLGQDHVAGLTFPIAAGGGRRRRARRPSRRRRRHLRSRRPRRLRTPAVRPRR